MLRKVKITTCLATLCLPSCAVLAAYQDDIGLYELRVRDASLTGNGIIVGQIEAQFNVDDYQTDPANTGLDPSLFRYYDRNFTWASGGETYDSSRESGHANIVGSRFFGVTSGAQSTDGVAPGVASIEVFEAGHYYNDLVQFGTQTDAVVVNQSFIFTNLTETQVDTVERHYDDYAANNNVLFVNGINNNGVVPPPASAYNGIAVNVAGDSASPLADGRSKPDISAPGSSLTSYVTPLVSGAATIMIQSALNDDGGTGTSTSASDIRTVKALLLNGATKPIGWTNTSTRPLDIDSGSGVLEVNQSHLQLIAGQYGPTQDEVLTEAGTPHPPPSGETENMISNVGWNLGSVTNTTTGRGINRVNNDVTAHYFFDLNSAEAAAFYLTSTLVWNRQAGLSSINNLDLFLYTESGTLVASSVSSVDNVEHIYEQHLAPGRYVLQVHKPYNSGNITNSETYALAFNFRPAPAPGTPGSLSANVLSSSEINLSWTDNSSNEDGFRIERRPTGGSYAEVSTVAANITSYSDTGLTDGTLYEYQITAFNSAGSSTAITASATTPLAPPTGATVSPISDSELQITWTDNSASETGYRIERLVDSSYSPVATVGANVESYNETGLTAGTIYTYRITAVNLTGDSTSVEASGTTYSKIEDWRLFYFKTIENSGEAADDSDPDFDSIANLIEFTTGSDPISFSPNPLNTAALGTDGQFSFTWRVDSGYDFSIGFSTDLKGGFTYYDSATLDSGSSPDLELIGTSGPIDGIETRTYGVRDSVTDPNVFLRLKVN